MDYTIYLTDDSPISPPEEGLGMTFAEVDAALRDKHFHITRIIEHAPEFPGFYGITIYYSSILMGARVYIRENNYVEHDFGPYCCASPEHSFAHYEYAPEPTDEETGFASYMMNGYWTDSILGLPITVKGN